MYGSKVTTPCDYCITMLCGTVRRGDASIMRTLLTKYKNLYDENHSDYNFIKRIKTSTACKSLLWQAVSSGFFEIAKMLLDHGADINERMNTEMRIIEVLASSRARGNWPAELESIDFLIKNGASIDLDPQYNTHSPLWFAIKERNCELVKLLVESGAELSGPEWAKESPLIMACATSDFGVLVPLFLQYGVDPTKLGVNFRNPLHYLTENELVRTCGASQVIVEVAELLVSHGVPLDEPDLNGVTPLLGAVERGIVPLVEYLLENGAQINRKSSTGLTALHYACRNCHEPLMRLLLEQGADVDLQDDRGETPLTQMKLKQNNLPPMARLTRHVAYMMNKKSVSNAYKNKKTGNQAWNRNVWSISKRPILWTHYNNCLKELEKMKEYPVYPGYFFYDILNWPNNKEIILELIKGSNIFAKNFEKVNRKTLFPCYNPDLKWIYSQVFKKPDSDFRIDCDETCD